VGVMLAGLLLSALTLAAASRPGRCALRHHVEPLASWLVERRAWQHLVYETGPSDPLLTLAAEALLPRGAFGKLAVALCLDAIGSFTYMLPGLGEIGDLVWAPLQAIIVSVMFEGMVHPRAHYLSFLEELLPGTDILPSATLFWARAYIPVVTGGAGKLPTVTEATARGGSLRAARRLAMEATPMYR